MGKHRGQRQIVKKRQTGRKKIPAKKASHFRLKRLSAQF